MFDARATGVLEGRANADDTACFWIGNGADQTVLVWPDGFSAAGDPIAIFNRAGTKLATVGQTVALAGGRSFEANGRVLGCDQSPVWMVGEVIEAH
jgi:hypothetical protein